MQILGLLGMYFDAGVVEIEKYLLFLRLALAILCYVRQFALEVILTACQENSIT